MVRVVSPDDIVEGIVLSKPRIGKAIIADPASIDDPDKFGTNAPTTKHKMVPANLLTNHSSELPVRINEVDFPSVKIVAMSIVPFIPQMPQAVNFEVFPPLIAKSLEDGADDIS